MAKAIITEERVYAAAEQLNAAGTEPTILNVQAAIGGGSYSTVKRYLDLWFKKRTDEQNTSTQIPGEVSSKANELLRNLWLAANKITQQEVQIIKTQAGEEIEKAKQELREALTEVQRLEAVETEQREKIVTLEKHSHALELEVASLKVAAKRAEDLQTEIDKIRPELGRAEQRALDYQEQAKKAVSLENLLGALQSKVEALTEIGVKRQKKADKK